jgi:hypothetical protein
MEHRSTHHDCEKEALMWINKRAIDRDTIDAALVRRLIAAQFPH